MIVLGGHIGSYEQMIFNFRIVLFLEAFYVMGSFGVGRDFDIPILYLNQKQGWWVSEL